MMTLAQIPASHWRSFLAIAGACFAVFASAVIFLLPGPRVLVRSAIDIGSHFVRGDTLAIYPAEPLAKRAQNVYVPLTLSAMSKVGTSTRTLSALQSSIIEPNQLSIVITTNVDANAEDAARKFQENLATLILDEEKSRVEVLREAMAAKAVATKPSDYEKQISTDREHIDRINKRMTEIEASRRDQQAELASLLQRQQSASQADEQTSVQARIRHLEDQLANEAAALTTLAIQQNSFVLALGGAEKLVQVLTEGAVERQLEQKSFSEPRVSLPPTAVLITPQWRRSGLLVVALVASLLIAFAAVAAISNLRAKNRGDWLAGNRLARSYRKVLFGSGVEL
jgi:hypothetical protein